MTTATSKRRQPIVGYRTMTAAQRYNARMERLMDECKDAQTRFNASSRTDNTPTPATTQEQPQANPDNDEFQCEQCKRIMDVENSVRLPNDDLICENCNRVKVANAIAPDNSAVVLAMANAHAKTVERFNKMVADTQKENEEYETWRRTVEVPDSEADQLATQEQHTATTYCQKCGTMTSFKRNYCNACTPKLPRWMRGKKWSFVRYSNNPDDKRWCIRPDTSLRPLFFADVPDATTTKESHDIGRFIEVRVNSHEKLVAALEQLEALAGQITASSRLVLPPKVAQVIKDARASLNTEA